jgi:hypothetical protein
MAPGKKPLGGELGRFAIADVLNAIVDELSPDFIARVLARLERRSGNKMLSAARADREASPHEEIELETRPGDDYTIAIKWRKGKVRTFRRCAFVLKLINGKRQDFGRWQGECVTCRQPFFVDLFASIKSEKSKRFAITTCPDHRKRNNIKSEIAPVVACDETSD